MNKKERNLITICLAVIGSYLFYKQGPGINKLIFTIISASVLIYQNREKEIRTLAIAILPSLISSVFIVWYPQLFTRIIWLLSYLFMWSVMVSTPYPIVIILQGLLSILESPFSLFKKVESKQTIKDGIHNRKGIIYTFTAIIVFIFTILYVNSNPVFSELLSRIDLSFIEIGFLFTIIGLFLLLYGLVQIKKNNSIQKLNLIHSFITKTNLTKRDEQEFLIAKLSVWIIGIILFIANVGDLIVIFTGKLPEGITYSEYVHQGFNTLILTMSLAIGVVIYFFRGQLNFHKKLKAIKSASVFWILQNLLLALITAHKNYLYVEVYGLTYKRIAVFLGLICVIIGLVLSLKKLQSPFTNWLYFNKLAMNAFICFVLMSFIPMDRLITKYNLAYSETVDITYLLSLSKSNLELLEDYINENEGKNSNNLLTIRNKISKLNEKASNCNWQSWNFYIYQYKDAQ